MDKRFYAPPPWDGPEVTLDESESHHLARVLRLQPGERVSVFDGEGLEAAAEIGSITRHGATLKLLGERTVTPAPERPIVLASAVPKGERFDWLIEKAAELGVDRFIPLITERSVVEPGAAKIERLQRSVIAAAKQCGRSRLMRLMPTTRWDQFVGQELAGVEAYVADPTGEAWYGPQTLEQLPPGMEYSRRTLLIIGPEGGFTPAELDAARNAGAKIVCLPTPILRIETAALALTAIFSMLKRDA